MSQRWVGKFKSTRPPLLKSAIYVEEHHSLSRGVRVGRAIGVPLDFEYIYQDLLQFDPCNFPILQKSLWTPRN